MSDQRKPLVGWERSAEANTNGVYTVFNAGGMAHTSATAEQIGIPAPPPPRTGTLWLSEEDTREMAGKALYCRTGLDYRTHDAAVLMCRDDVARWDAEDEAARTAVPDTLTVELPIKSVWSIADPGWFSDEMRSASAACQAALDEAGIA